MKFLMLAVSLFLITNAFPSYALPPVEKRHILLLDVKRVKIEDGKFILHFNGQALRLEINTFFMQDRIFSDGICVGVLDASPRSAVFRVNEVKAAIDKKSAATVLVEICRLKAKNELHLGQNEFFVSYMKIFDAESEFKRYFVDKQSYDTIQLDESVKPKTAAEFEADLTKRSTASIEELKNQK